MVTSNGKTWKSSGIAKWSGKSQEMKEVEVKLVNLVGLEIGLTVVNSTFYIRPYCCWDMDDGRYDVVIDE